ncbi:MAG TPA: glycosyltransferase family 4 protein, partial [Oscillatoriaceae cyanobacterium]
MRIALTVGRFDLSGGIERVTVQLARGYQALGHDVTVFATGWDADDRFTFRHVTAPERPAWLRTLQLPGATTRALARDNFDFVHGQGTSTWHCDLLTFHSVHAAWLAHSVGESGTWSPTGIAKRLYPFHRAAIAVEHRQVRTHRGKFHGCSPEVACEIIRHYDADPARVFAEPWGIDFEEFRPDAVARARMRSTWEVDDGTRVVLLVANEFHRKGLGPLLEALALLDRRDLVLAVAGRADTAPYRALAERLGVAARVRFLGHQSPAPCYQAADLFALPSTYEGWGLVVGEALASGLPVVASRFPGSIAMIEPDRNGYLLDDPRDPKALAGAIERTLNPNTHMRLASFARNSV